MWRERRRLILLAGVAAALAGTLLAMTLRSGESGLIDQLKNGTPEMRVQAIHGLERIGSKSAADAIAGAVNDADARLAGEAVAALGRLGRPEHLGRVKAASKSGNEQVREAAAAAMGGFGDHADVGLLIDSVADVQQGPRVRAAAAQSLGRLDDYAAMPALIQALEDPSPLVRGRAYAAIRQILQLDVGFRARDPEEKRRADIARIKELYEICRKRHEDYVQRKKEWKR